LDSPLYPTSCFQLTPLASLPSDTLPQSLVHRLDSAAAADSVRKPSRQVIVLTSYPRSRGRPHPQSCGHPRSLLLCRITCVVLVVQLRVERQSAVHQPVPHHPDGCFCDCFYGAERVLSFFAWREGYPVRRCLPSTSRPNLIQSMKPCWIQ
jgi:hypothetical protein